MMLHLHLGGKGETCLCGLSSVIYQCVEGVLCWLLHTSYFASTFLLQYSILACVEFGPV